MSVTGFIDGIMGWQWKTLAGHRCLVSGGGKIIKGPRDWEGVHVFRLREFLPEWRELKATEGTCGTPEDAASKVHRATFPNKAIPVHAILAANPELYDRIHEDGALGTRYAAWVKNNHKGHKPTLGMNDGRFDAINEAQDRKGTRRIVCWLEAIYATLPTSRLWDEIDLAPLAKAHGKPLNLPEEAELRRIAAMTAEQCADHYATKMEEIRAHYSETRPTLEAAPF